MRNQGRVKFLHSVHVNKERHSYTFFKSILFLCFNVKLSTCDETGRSKIHPTELECPVLCDQVLSGRALVSLWCCTHLLTPPRWYTTPRRFIRPFLHECVFSLWSSAGLEFCVLLSTRNWCRHCRPLTESVVGRMGRKEQLLPEQDLLVIWMDLFSFHLRHPLLSTAVRCIFLKSLPCWQSFQWRSGIFNANQSKPD